MKKTIRFIIVISLIVSLIFGSFYAGYFHALATLMGLESDPWLTQPLQESSYIVGRYNATHYYGKNHTGYGTEANEGYEFLSTNVSDLVQSAIDNLVDGGKILSVVGVYEFDSTITLPSYITLEGESASRSSTKGTVWKMVTDDTNLIESEDSPTLYSVIRNIAFYGKFDKDTNPTDTGIAIYGKFRYCDFENLDSWKFSSHIKIDDYAPYCDALWDNHIVNCYFSSSRTHGIWLGENCTDTIITESHIEYARYSINASAVYIDSGGGHRLINNVFDTSYINIWIHAGSARILGNNIDQANTTGIWLLAKHDETCAFIQLVGNKISRSSRQTDNTYSGILLEGIDNTDTNNTKSIVIIGNYFVKAGAGLGQQKHCVEFKGVGERDVMCIGNDGRWGYQTSFYGGTNATSSTLDPNDY